ncbi:hypothetical protein GIW70_16425 [Pseudomonas syringae]|nr:hypothetical protein [Pseudomonas syringae]MCF5069776.1 hypothetical protein [Pseudomonas syringae]
MAGNKIDPFMATLFVNGIPLMLNKYVMEQRLLRPRLTTRQRLEAEIAINNPRSGPIVTLADDDEATPLLLEFVPDNNRYVIYARTPGAYFGWHLEMSGEPRALRVAQGTKTLGSYFSLENTYGKLTAAKDFQFSPMSLSWVSEERNRGLYLGDENSVRFFMDANPNKTVHHAFNGLPCTFVLRKV